MRGPEPAVWAPTHARREGDEWVSSGQKHDTTDGASWDGWGAHLVAVMCRTDLERPPAQSVAVILVPDANSRV